ncbi:nuclease A inhibitor family protein [Pseudanabaena sp. 'Roaring Creek']|uniref:nuclease A inhibitor family protein n=1 Tax=Pseudanabaena sp. 'Roaring Creek' TaxID=1681830 RepID=UPI0006D85FE8|nr:nuclease A inhibitor family protein [Pseudanabaena sp. 'Roaring Creek']
MTSKKIFDRLSTLAKGLQFPSESEFPLEPFLWESTTLLPANILHRANKPAIAPIEAIALQEFFAPVTDEREWYDDDERAIAQRFRDLEMEISALENVQVFKVGQVEIDVYIVGAIDLDLVGLKTTVIET